MAHKPGGEKLYFDYGATGKRYDAYCYNDYEKCPYMGCVFYNCLKKNIFCDYKYNHNIKLNEKISKK